MNKDNLQFVSSGTDIHYVKLKVRGGEWSKVSKGVHKNGKYILLREGKKYTLYEPRNPEK